MLIRGIYTIQVAEACLLFVNNNGAVTAAYLSERKINYGNFDKKYNCPSKYISLITALK